MREFLLYWAWICKGNNLEIFKKIKNAELVNFKLLEDIKQKLEKTNIKYITFLDSDYPNDLLQLKYPPYVLFYKGNINLLKGRELLNITGEINGSISKFTISYLNEKIFKKSTLVTNQQTDLDYEVINLFKKHKSNIIYLLASGIKSESREYGRNELILSQFPPDYHVKREHYSMRNLICAGISKRMILISTKEESKLIHLAYAFADYGKNVFCFPGIQWNDTNSELIKNGAQMITNISDVVYF